MKIIKMRKREVAVKLTLRNMKKKVLSKFKNGRMSFSKQSLSKRKTVRNEN